MVSALPEPPSAMSAEKSAGVRDGMEAFAFGTSERAANELPGREESDVQNALNFPGFKRIPRQKCFERNFNALAEKSEPGRDRAAARKALATLRALPGLLLMGFGLARRSLLRIQKPFGGVL